jgi:hypothetical protein
MHSKSDPAACKITVLIKKMYYMYPFQNMSKQPFSLDTILSQQQPNQNTDLQFKSTRATQNSTAMKYVAMPLSELYQTWSHTFLCFYFCCLFPGQGTVCMPLEHGYGAWENKDKVHNGDRNDSDSNDKDGMSH